MKPSNGKYETQWGFKTPLGLFETIRNIAVANDEPAIIDCTRVNNDSNGNGRFVVHFLSLVTAEDRKEADAYEGRGFGERLTWLYNRALVRAKRRCGRKFHNQQFGGGVIFQAGSEDEVREKVKDCLASRYRVKFTGRDIGAISKIQRITEKIESAKPLSEEQLKEQVYAKYELCTNFTISEVIGDW